MHWVTIIGIILIAIGTGLTFWGQDLKSKNDKLDLKNQVNDLVVGKDQVIKQNQELSEKISAYQDELIIKDEKISKLERGLTSSYDFNGVKRTTTRPGHVNVIVGKETATYQRMVELQEQKNFSELVEVCEKQIISTPEWLTPHLFLGVGYANLDRKEEAIEQFEYVIENSHGDPAYSEANTLLEKLR